MALSFEAKKAIAELVVGLCTQGVLTKITAGAVTDENGKISIKDVIGMIGINMAGGIAAADATGKFCDAVKSIKDNIRIKVEDKNEEEVEEEETEEPVEED